MAPSQASVARKPGETPLVSETVLKRRHDLDEMKARRAANLLKNPHISRKIASARKEKVFKPDTFIKKARNKRNLSVRYRRVLQKGMHTRASDKKQFKDKVATNSINAPVVFCVRVKGRKQALPQSMYKILQHKLGLNGENTGVFLRYTAETRKQLQLVEPFVLYGVLSQTAISDLIHRKGHALIQKDGEDERVPLSDNRIVEEALGKHDLICIQDLVHEIDTAGPHLDNALQFLAPFRLAAPKSKFQKKVLEYVDTREDYGDKGEEMEEIVKTMM